MSRVGKRPIVVPSGVDVQINGTDIEVKGSKGALKHMFGSDVAFKRENDQIIVEPMSDTRQALAMWGTARNLLNNMIVGVSAGFTIEIMIIGVGFKAAVDKGILTLSLGYSHDIKYIIPEGINIKTIKPTELEITGFDKQLVGSVAAEIMKLRKADPYKGKGIYKKGQYIRRKEGKKK